MKVRVLLLATFTLLTAAAAFAQSHEVALTSGGLKIGERGFDLPQPGFLKFSSGLTYQLSYAQRLLDAKLAALYFEIPLAGTPRTKVNTQNALTPKTYSSLFFTPGVKLKLLPGRKYSPFALMGVGLAHFREGDTRTNNQPNPNPSARTDAVFDFGFGLDVRLIRVLSIRGEVRDFYAELPPLSVRALSDRQHNALISGGVVVRF